VTCGWWLVAGEKQRKTACAVEPPGEKRRKTCG